MNRSLTAIGVLLFLAAVSIVIVRSSKGDAEVGLREVGGRNPEVVEVVDSERNSNFRTTKRRVDRRTLAESLPEGTTVEDSKVIPGGIDVALANGLRIAAAGASVTDKGVTFAGPFQVDGPIGYLMSGDNAEAMFQLSLDGKSFKALGETTTTYGPLRK